MKQEAQYLNKECVIIFEDKQEHDKFDDSVSDINISESRFLKDEEIEDIFNSIESCSIKKVNDSNIKQ